MKITNAIIASAILAAPAAFGFPLYQEVKAPSSNRGPAPSVQCVSFEGYWNGTCTTVGPGGTSTENGVALSFGQLGCELVRIDNQDFQIGGISTTTSAGNNGHSAATVLLDWNADKSVLGGTTVNVFSGDGYTASAQGTIEFKLAGAQLKSSSASTSEVRLNADGKVSKTTSTTECTYDKNQ